MSWPLLCLCCLLRWKVPCGSFRRYLVPADLTVGQFVYVIRKRIKLSPERAIFIFIDNKLPPSGDGFGDARSAGT